MRKERDWEIGSIAERRVIDLVGDMVDSHVSAAVRSFCRHGQIYFMPLNGNKWTLSFGMGNSGWDYCSREVSLLSLIKKFAPDYYHTDTIDSLLLDLRRCVKYVENRRKEADAIELQRIIGDMMEKNPVPKLEEPAT